MFFHSFPTTLPTTGAFPTIGEERDFGSITFNTTNDKTPTISKYTRSSVGKSSISSKASTSNAIGTNGGKVRLRERRSNGGIKASQNPNRASYPSGLLPTVKENRSVDNRCQYNPQHYQPNEILNKQGSETNLSIGLVGGNGGVSGFINNMVVSGSSSNERLSGTDGKLCCSKCLNLKTHKTNKMGNIMLFDIT